MKHFCNKAMQSQSSGQKNEEDGTADGGKKGELLHKLRQKLHTRRIGDRKPGVGLGKCKPKKETRNIDIAWMHYDADDQKFKLVRKTQGGGTRTLSVSRTSTAETIKKIAEGLFFKDGRSTKGKLEDHETTLVDVGHQHIPSSHTVNEMYMENKMRVLQFYLQTRSKVAKRDHGVSSK